MSPILTTVLVTPKATLLYGAKGSAATPLQVVNLDNTNTLYLSTQSNPVPNQPGTFPVAPLSSLSFDGSVGIYGITSGPNVIAGIVPGGQGYSPGALAISGPVTATISGPVTVNGNVGITGTPSVNVANTPSVNISGTPNVNIANTPAVTVSSGSVAVSSVSGTIDVSGSSVDITTGNVNATGVGGFILPGNVASLYSNTSNQNIGGGSNLTLLNLQDVTNYNSFDMSFAVGDPSQALVNHAHAYQLSLTWYDDLVTGIPVYQETWWPWVSDTLGTAPVRGTGPMHGKYMTVIISNPVAGGAATQITLSNAVIFGSGRVTTQSDFRQQATPKIDQSAHIIVNPVLCDDNYIADSVGMVAVTANLTYVIFLGLYSGPIDWAMQIGGGGGLTRSNLINLGSAAGVQSSGNLNPQRDSIEVLATGVGAQQSGSQKMPRAACAAIFTVGAANTTIEFTAVAQQGP